MKLKKYIITSLLFSVLFLLASCVKNFDIQPQPVAGERPLLTLLENNYSFSVFYQAIKRLGLDKTLNGTEAYTLLVPDNDAFALAGITSQTVSSIDTASLRKIIGYHIVKGALPYSKIPQTVDYQFSTLIAQPVYFSVSLPDPNRPNREQLLHVNGVTAKKTDVMASNGVIHVLENVLTSPAASVKSILNDDPNYSLFVQALKQFGLFEQLDKAGPFVVLAPSNEVFMQNGIDESTLATLDTLTYKKFLFAPYLIPGKFFFKSDLDDAPLTGGIHGVRGADYLLFIDYYAFNFQLFPDKVDPYYYANTVQFSSPDHLAYNGVVHGVNGLLITPDYALKP
ncbi:fasciclin domain-containing protein [Pedobacter sp. WC2501]|uniref:fasciclin domain-containing protein n=1 Tax=Pedobacter sp. WC2501 TaxID=3461400 RepID=UPI0040466ED2